MAVVEHYPLAKTSGQDERICGIELNVQRFQQLAPALPSGVWVATELCLRKWNPWLLQAAKRRENAAHGASRGWQVGTDQAPKGRKNGYDTDSFSLAADFTSAISQADVTSIGI